MAGERMKKDRERIALDERAISDEIDWRELLGSLNRKKWGIAAATLALTALILGLLSQLSPRYTAEAVVGIDARRFQAVDIKDVVSNLPVDINVVNSEIEVVRSRALAEKVVAQLRLVEEPEFNEALAPQNPGILWRMHPRNLAPALWQEMLPTRDDPERTRTLAVDKFLERLSVQPKGVSYIFAIRFVARDPAMAATIVNTLTDLYIAEQEEVKREGNRRANAWLEERVQQMLGQVQTLERRIDAYRQGAGLIQGRNSYVSEQQLAELNTQLVLAKSRRAEAEARYAQVRSLLNGSGQFEATTEVLASPLIQSLREKEAEVLRNESQLSETYGPRHPKILNNQAELRDLRRLIAEEIRKIADGLANELAIARASEENLARTVGALEQRAGEIQQAEIGLNELQREADAARALYETFLTRLNETTAQTGFQRPDARIVTRANPPEKPTFPNMPLLGTAAFLGALILAVVGALVLEGRGRVFRSARHVERLLGLPTVALVPRLPRRRQTADHVLADPRSAYAESIHGILASLRVMDDSPQRSVLITSAVAGEGKSLLALSLARVAARSGRRVLLVDGDLRAPRIHGLLGLSREGGLSELLAGDADAATLRTDAATGLHVLTAGADRGHPADLLARPATKAALDAMAARYDLVVFDSPPVLAAVDALLLCRIADRTFYLVQWERTPVDTAQAGLRLLNEADARTGGVILSKVDLRRYARYGDAGAVVSVSGAFARSVPAG